MAGRIPTTDENFGSLADIAIHYDVSLETVAWWKKFKRGFPAKTVAGYSRDGMEDFLKTNQLGPYRPVAMEKSRDDNGLTDRERLLAAKANNEELLQRTREIELAEREGKILLADDVQSFHSQLAATILTTLDALPDAIDREIPEKPPKLKDWRKIRERINATCKRLIRDVANVAREFVNDSAG